MIPGCLLLLSPTSLTGQEVSPDAQAVVDWMDAYANLPEGPSNEQLPRYVPGWFEEIEVRTETDEFSFRRQRYTLRGEPKLPSVRRAEQRVQNAQRDQLSNLGADELADSRADALTQLFEIATDLREAALVDTLIQVQGRLVDLTRLRVVEPGYDIENVLDAEDDLADLKLRLKELKSLNDDVKTPISPNQLVELEDIRLHLLAIAEQGPAKALGQEQSLEQIDAEIALERAENLSFLKFVQVQYRDSPDPNDLTREQLSVGGSISFPRRERHIRQLDELKVKRLEERYDFDLKARERERKFSDDIANLQRLVERYEDLKANIQARRLRRDRLSQTYLQSSQTRPESLLRLSRRNLSDRLNLLQMEEDVRESYAVLLGDFITLDAAGIQRWVLK